MTSPDPERQRESQAGESPANADDRPAERVSRQVTLAESQTHANLLAALAATGVAQLRALWSAQEADVDGRPDAARSFRSVADDLTSSAFGLLEFLVDIDDPTTGKAIGDTEDNIAASIASEAIDRDETYPAFAATARDEGFGQIAEWFDSLGDAAARHVARLADQSEDS